MVMAAVGELAVPSIGQKGFRASNLNQSKALVALQSHADP